MFGGYTPEPPLREGVEGDPLQNPPPGRPPALRAYGRPTAAARPIVGTQTSRPPLGKILATPMAWGITFITKSLHNSKPRAAYFNK
jgi:hypothetical protein